MSPVVQPGGMPKCSRSVQVVPECPAWVVLELWALVMDSDVECDGVIESPRSMVARAGKRCVKEGVGLAG